MCRTIARTYGFGAQPERVELVRQVLSSIWPLFVGNEEEMCDEESFVRLGGMAESMIASFGNIPG